MMMCMPRSSDWDRRDFLRSGSAAAVGLALQTKARAAKSDAGGEWRSRVSGMAYRRLGRTNYMVSEIVCGGNTIAPDNYRHVEEAIERGSTTSTRRRRTAAAGANSGTRRSSPGRSATAFS